MNLAQVSSLATTDQNLALGKRLLTVRAATGLSQQAFAVSLGLSPRAYANYERGEREMPVVLFRVLCNEHGIDPLWLLAGPEREPVHVNERRLNLALLEEVIRVIEKALNDAGKRLPPRKKARLTRLAYERCVRSGDVNAGEIRDFLSLAA